MQRTARARAANARRVLAGLVGVVADAEPEVEAVGLVAEAHEDVPERERVLAARHRDQHPVARLEHAVRVDGPADLLVAVVHEVVAGRTRRCGGARR